MEQFYIDCQCLQQNPNMSEQKNQSVRTYRNHSNIQFNDSAGGKIEPSNNYRSHSQVGRMMTDQIQPSQSKPVTYQYKNKIAQVNKNYELHQSIYPRFQKTNTQYQQFFHKTHKFVKPYTECTKYVDSLMKNKQLLRRGAFDLPTEPISAHGLTKTSFSQAINQSQSNEYSRHNKTAQLKRHCETMQNIVKRKPSSDQKNGFDKTMKQQLSSYKTLLNQQRKNQKQEIKFKNSMNRILAVEMINYRLLSSGKSLKPVASLRSESQHI